MINFTELTVKKEEAGGALRSAAGAFVAELHVEAVEPRSRQSEPVTCGIPWPQGAIVRESELRLFDCDGRSVPVQARSLERWPDGSVRWLLLDWQATLDGATRYYCARPQTRHHQVLESLTDPLTTVDDGRRITIRTGPAVFQLDVRRFPFVSVEVDGHEVLDPERSGLFVEDGSGQKYQTVVRRLTVVERGPLRTAVRIDGELVGAAGEALCEFFSHLHFFAGSVTVRVALTLRNPRRAQHPGGLWDLGDPGSVFLRDTSLVLTMPAEAAAGAIWCSPEPGLPLERSGGELEIYQDSSGGEQWNSSNHVNRHGIVPFQFRGYRFQSGSNHRMGHRATPIVQVRTEARTLSVAMRHFWQNFPKAIEATDHSITLRLFPQQHKDVHELQGGEQKTHAFHIAFGTDHVTEEPLAWCRAPMVPRATPEWYCSSGAIPYLTPERDDSNTDYIRLVRSAIEGEESFERKRERIDEYGWRNFGDIYADHEAVFHQGTSPLISHFNNQYDVIAGCGYQFLRSGDSRWWTWMDDMAAHVADIDIYHTERDKSAYNHGLFWHTFHYVDVDTASHRSYPKRRGVCGGGPSSSHNYATGLMLHYFLTGDPISRESAIGLAQWVIDMDSGRKTVFRWLARGHTGLASASGTPDYHGPGRGSGNSVSALLDGHRLTGDPKYMAKAEQLICRCIHPADDIESRDLGDAESKWFYTIFLYSIGKYLDYKEELGELDHMYSYARASLLCYARWMAENEYPYLEKPEKLEYPTETWAAQEMRKSEVFKFAAKHAAGIERDRFLERSEFFFRYSVTKLGSMPTRSLARPVALILRNGLMHSYFQHNPNVTAAEPADGNADFGQPQSFVPQKAVAKKRFKFLACLALTLSIVSLVIWLTVALL